MVSPLSMPRPAYKAAHSPAGPAPTMITSYSFLRCSVIRLPFSVVHTEFEPRSLRRPPGRPLVARQCSGQLRPERDGVELDVGALRPVELLQCRTPQLDHAVPVAALPVQQRSRGLNEALPHPGLSALLNNRTPDGFQRFVREPVVAPIEQLAGVLEVRAALLGSHQRSAVSHQSTALTTTDG